jgi:hypothetical protein
LVASPAVAASSVASPAIAASSVASPVSSTSLVPHSTNTYDQYQSIMSLLQNSVTQDQFQSLISMITRLERSVMAVQDDISRLPVWTETTVGIRERQYHQRVSPYPPTAPSTALSRSPQRRHAARSSSPASPVTSQSSYLSFAGVTTSSPRESDG